MYQTEQPKEMGSRSWLDKLTTRSSDSVMISAKLQTFDVMFCTDFSNGRVSSLNTKNETNSFVLYDFDVVR